MSTDYKKVLITGVAGFVGSNLAKALLNNGIEVIGIDDFSHGFERNITELLPNKKFTFLKKDARDPDTFKGLKADVIVHLASQKIPRYSSALLVLDDNSLMTKNIVKKCIDDKIKMVFASTSDIYGKNPKLPYSETSDMLLGPTTVKRWAYAISKIYSEQYLIANHEEFGLTYTIMRFFGSYGTNQNPTWWGGPQSVFIEKAYNDDFIELHGDGSQTRTFTYIDDTVQGVMKCIFHENSTNDIFNIAGDPDSEITIRDLAHLIWGLMRPGTEPKIKCIPYSTFGNYEDVQRRLPDISKIKSKLGYEPKWKLAEGLKQAIEWQTKLYK
ncbi:MAG: NAD-dependent epimerase/dehydratase family protein [Flavobacteriales bacterium]